MGIFGNSKKIKEQEKQIDILKHEIAELQQIIKTQELIALRNQKALFQEQSELISHVQLHLNDIHVVDEDNGTRYVLVKYEQPILKLYIDADNKIVENKMFRAINKLRLLPNDDLMKIKHKLDAIKEEK